jgi:hypothetical protein
LLTFVLRGIKFTGMTKKILEGGGGEKRKGKKRRKWKTRT